MEEMIKAVYEQFDAKRKAYQALEADNQDIEDIEKQVKNRTLFDESGD